MHHAVVCLIAASSVDSLLAYLRFLLSTLERKNYSPFGYQFLLCKLRFLKLHDKLITVLKAIDSFYSTISNFQMAKMDLYWNIPTN